MVAYRTVPMNSGYAVRLSGLEVLLDPLSNLAEKSLHFSCP